MPSPARSLSRARARRVCHHLDVHVRPRPHRPKPPVRLRSRRSAGRRCARCSCGRAASAAGLARAPRARAGAWTRARRARAASNSTVGPLPSIRRPHVWSSDVGALGRTPGAPTAATRSDTACCGRPMTGIPTSGASPALSGFPPTGAAERPAAAGRIAVQHCQHGRLHTRERPDFGAVAAAAAAAR